MRRKHKQKQKQTHTHTPHTQNNFILGDTGYTSDTDDVPYFNCMLNFVCDGFDAENQCAKGYSIFFVCVG